LSQVKEVVFITSECRLQDPKKLGSSIKLSQSGLSKSEQLDLLGDWTEAQQEVIAVARHHYKRMINLGVSPDVARVLLPMGLVSL
jgi:thymidylate synthase ThyX